MSCNEVIVKLLESGIWCPSLINSLFATHVMEFTDENAEHDPDFIKELSKIYDRKSKDFDESMYKSTTRDIGIL